MKPLSSTPSSRTLRLAGLLTPLPRATLIALVLVICAEGAARWGIASGRIEVDSTGRGIFDSYVAALRKTGTDCWLLGNSTLNGGVDKDILSKGLGQSISKMPIGSCSVRASAALLERYLKEAKLKPKRVILFVNVDDLNVNGERTKVSTELEKMAQSSFRHPQEYFMLYQARGDIVGKFTGPFKKSKPKVANEGPKTERRWKGPEVTPDTYREYEGITKLVKDYEFDKEAIPRFAAAAKAGGVSDITLVLMPITDSFQRFHDQVNPQIAYSQIRKQFAEACVAAGVPYIDNGEPLTDYSQFQDPYHLSPTGREKYTPKIVGQLALPVRSDTPATGPTSGSAASKPS